VDPLSLSPAVAAAAEPLILLRQNVMETQRTSTAAQSGDSAEETLNTAIAKNASITRISNLLQYIKLSKKYSNTLIDRRHIYWKFY
jgi:hypothetical protein